MNPGQPGAPAPAGGDAAALTSIIGSLGEQPAPSINFDGPTDPFAGPSAPVAPVAPPAFYPQAPAGPPAPVAPPVYTPPAAAPTIPQYTPPAPAQYQPAPGIPGGPALPPAPTAPVAPIAPQIDPNAIPLSVTAPPAAATVPQNGFTPEQVQSMIDTALRAAQPAAAAPVAPAAPTEWAPASWADVEARIEQRAAEMVNLGATQANAQAEARRQQETENQRRANEYIDTQVRTLEQTGYLPPITNPADPADPGRAAHQELFAYAISLGTDNLSAVAPTLFAHHQAGYYYDRGTNRLVRRGSTTAAAQAPIAGASPTGPAPSTNGLPTQADFGRLSLHDLAERANAAYPLTPGAA